MIITFTDFKKGGGTMKFVYFLLVIVVAVIITMILIPDQTGDQLTDTQIIGHMLQVGHEQKVSTVFEEINDKRALEYESLIWQQLF